MTHTRVPKIFNFSPNDFEITEIASRNLVVTGITNYHAKALEFSNFVVAANPTALLTHGNEVSRLWHEIFGHLNLNTFNKFKKIPCLKASQPSKLPMEFAKVVLSASTLSINLIGERQVELHVFWG